MTIATITTHQEPPVRLKCRQEKNVKTVIWAVATANGLTPEKLLAPGREEPRQTTRQIAVFLARELTALSSIRLRPFFGFGDHGTVRHAIQRIRERCNHEPELSKRVLALAATCRSLIAPAPTKEDV